MTSVYGPCVSVCTPNTTGNAPDELANGVLGFSSQTWIRASVSSWTVCGSIWQRQVHWYVRSHRWSIGFRSGEQEGQSVASVPSSSRNCLYTLATESPAVSLHQEERRAYCTNVSSGSQPDCHIGYDKEFCAALQGYTSPDHHWPTAKPIQLDDVTDSITEFGQRHVHQLPNGGNFVGLW